MSVFHFNLSPLTFHLFFLTLADAKKVLVFSKYYYSLTDIVNNAFSVTGQIGTGVALIFLDANNKYIGNLSSQGLNMLPLDG